MLYLRCTFGSQLVVCMLSLAATCAGDEDARAFCEAQLTRQAAARAADRGKGEAAQQLHERAAVLFKQCGEKMHLSVLVRANSHETVAFLRLRLSCPGCSSLTWCAVC